MLIFVNELSEIPMSHVEIACETTKDLILFKVFDYVKNGWPNHMSDQSILPYFRICNYISIVEDCLVFGCGMISYEGVKVCMRNQYFLMLGI